VEVRRVISRADTVEGFVVGVGTKWALMANLNPGVFLDGYCAVRVADIGQLTRPKRGSFVRCALELHGEWPPVAPPRDLPLGNTVGLVAAAGALFDLVTLHVEREDPEVCFVGKPVEGVKGRVRILEVDPRAKWQAKPSQWAPGRVTRVEFGGRYELALADVARRELPDESTVPSNVRLPPPGLSI
jgi:hypothetical protein